MCPAKHQAYCLFQRKVVDLKQEFVSCALENQCFSDDLCPLSAKFQPQKKPLKTAPKPGQAPPMSPGKRKPF